MKHDMLMPQMGESITEATISKWLKKVGDSVKKDEIILEISTDKVDSEIPAHVSGVLTEVLFKEGDVVPVNIKIAVIDSELKVSNEQNVIKAEPQPNKSKEVSQATAIPTVQDSAISNRSNIIGDKLFSPLVRNMAEQHSVSLKDLEVYFSQGGTGSGGRISKQDFLNFIDAKENSKTSLKEQISSSTQFKGNTVTTTPSNSAYNVPTIGEWTTEGTRIVPMDRMRQAISEHMVRSKHTSPHVYSIQEVDCSKISRYRSKFKSNFQNQEGFNLSFTPFFLEATVKALGKYPLVNSSVSEKSIIMKRNINLGCAVALGTSGLIVPVIKKAEELTLVGIARSLNTLALKARDKKLLPEDVANGTFTVTNVGGFGTLIGTPIISQPQVAILCIGAIQKRPVVVEDMIAIREMCYITLSYDHRIIDGSLGGQFLAFVREYIENWDEKRPLL
jgi:2-oxoglutarate dehydrogenase E2 component (dihydrolipoamide succinyltransferase)